MPILNLTLTEAGTNSLDRADLDRRFNAIELSMEKDLKEIEPSLNAIEATYESAKRKSLRGINEVLEQRAGIGPDSDKASVRQIKPLLTITYQPHLIPVRISVNTRGELNLSSSGALPTPIGVFSIEAAAYLAKEKTLTIIHQGKKHLYRLGDKPFSFDVSEYTGPVNISYDGKGNVTIHLE